MAAETAGADFVQVKPPKVCKRCGGEMTVAFVKLPGAVYKWRNFQRQPIERDGRRFYLPHRCPR